MRSDTRRLAERFEDHRPHLRAVSLRLLGSASDADDAVQEAWLRLSRADADAIEHLGAWLTTVVTRICLNLLRSRTARREEPLEAEGDGMVVVPATGPDPQAELELADAVGSALLVLLETLSPAERVAFVLHDLFAVPFDEIAPMVDRTPDAARQLASRARRRVRGATPTGEPDPARRRAIVDAFFAAAREGDLAGLLATLDPQVVLRADAGPQRTVEGAEAVAARALLFARLAGPGGGSRPAWVDGAAGVVSFRDGRPVAVLALAVEHGRITAIDVVADPERIARIDLSGFSPRE